MSGSEHIADFLDGAPHAVVGASTNRAKFGNKILRCYQQDGRQVYAVNPRASEIEGAPCVADLAALPEPVHGVSIVTPPAITEEVVEQAIELGIQYLWMQPGAEHEAAIERAREAGLQVIAGGPCLLVELGFRG